MNPPLDLMSIVIAALQGIAILVSITLIGAFLSWIERRLLGLWQDRYGPNRVGPFGILQLAADMLKMFFKEDWIPPFADKFLFVLAPLIAMGSVLLAFMIIPIAPGVGVLSNHVGLLFFFAMAGLTVYAVLFAGWSSHNKFALLGSLRASAQTLSYEVFMGLSLMGVVASVGSFDLREIVQYQINHTWFVIPQILGALTFFVAGVAVTHRHPFDQPEAEQDLADGYHIEYSGMKWGLFFVGEYVGMLLVSSLFVTLFLGGWQGPFVNDWPNVGILWFALKVSVLLVLFILLRASLPRPRYDQVMKFGWVFCLPLTLINLLVTAFLILWQGDVL